MSETRLQAPLALVTGASRGIGRACVQRLLQDGHRVLSVDRVAPAQTEAGETFLQADLLDEGALAPLLERIRSEFDVSVLVNNAAVVKLAHMEDVSLDDLRTSVELNVAAGMRLAQAVVPQMKRMRHGRIVNIASRAALGKPLRSAYAATKAAMLGLTRTWALELAPYGITVNCIGPGPIATDLFRAANPPDSPQTRAILATVPAGRLGQPEEIAHAVSFFAHRQAAFTTGQVLYVCGGMTVGLAAI